MLYNLNNMNKQHKDDDITDDDVIDDAVSDDNDIEEDGPYLETVIKEILQEDLTLLREVCV